MTNMLHKKRLCIAFASMDGGHWTAGTHYLRNLFSALRSLPEKELVEIALLTADSNGPESLRPFVDRILTVAGLHNGPRFWERQWIRIGRRFGIQLEPKSVLGAFLHDQGVDALFSDTEYGARFSLPLLSWIPDFQHRHLPEMFSEAELENRDQHFSRIVKHASRVILSSQNALADLAAFAPNCVTRARVLPFVAQVPAHIYEGDPKWVCEKYHLPERFIYLPNQFWKHKNHETVIDALSITKQHRAEVIIICTGNTNDARHPLYFAQLMARIAERGLRDQLIILGLVPHDHTFALMRQSLTVLQPSLFEGWSTTVEEAKSLGKSLILSNLAVHQEQAPPEGTYFAPHDPAALAECLKQVFVQKRSGPDLELEESARSRLAARTRQLGQTFRNIVSELGIPPRHERTSTRL